MKEFLIDLLKFKSKQSYVFNVQTGSILLFLEIENLKNYIIYRNYQLCAFYIIPFIKQDIPYTIEDFNITFNQLDKHNILAYNLEGENTYFKENIF